MRLGIIKKRIIFEESILLVRNINRAKDINLLTKAKYYATTKMTIISKKTNLLSVLFSNDRILFGKKFLNIFLYYLIIRFF